MEGFFFAVSLVLLAFPILAIVALVKTVGLSARLASIEHRMAAMESQPRGAPIAAPPPTSTAPPAAPYTEPTAAAKPAQAPPVPPVPPPSPPERPVAAVPPIAPQP